MKRWLQRGVLVFLVLTTIPAHPIAQGSATPAVTVTPNVNVLRNVSDPLLGDANLQRQTEPVVAVSTRNPEHIMVAANDYRTVDIATDQGIGQVFAQAIRTVARTAEKLWARVTGRSEGLGEAEEEERERAEAGTEAWIGVYVTNDRGRNWTNAWMPGYPQDTSAAGKGSPAYGRQAASDPVLVSAPAGRFYLGAMAFDRGGASKIVVSRFTDRNNSEKGNNFHFDLMRAVDEGSTGKVFLDKPSIVADVARSVPDAGACGPVYIGYTVFDSKAIDPSDRSKIYVATSLDCGNTWLSPRKINRQSKLVQGVTLAVRPSDGRLYAVYRDFEVNRMFVTWADDRGYTFAPPVDISGPMLTFDQPSLGSPDYAFRSNGFPTLAVTGGNTAYAAWQERLAANGNPRIVVTSSVNGGPWTTKKAVEADRCVKNANGTTTCGVQAGPQVMPSLTSSRGRVMLAFYEARPGIDDVKFVASQKASYITGLDVQLYLRVAQLDASGKGVSAIATQYDVDKDGKPLPLIATDGATEYRGANRGNLPMYAGGKFPFIGDYISIAPSMPFVRTAPNTASTTASNSLGFFKESTTTGKKDTAPYWRWATESNDGPTASFQAAWTDNRDVIFPRNAAGLPRINGDWSQYAPPGFGPCINPGSRNANVYTAEIAPRLVAGSPTTFKQFGIQRAFVLYLQNRTADRKFFRMTIVDTPEANGSFLQRGADLNVRDVEIFPLSTVTDSVYVNGGSATSQPVRVDIAEIDRQGGSLISGGDTASVVFNGDNSNPPLETATPTSETHTPKLFSPGHPNSSLPKISNPQLANPQLANPQLANLQLTNSPYADPSGDVIKNVTNYTWQITNAGSTSSAFTPVFNIANQAALQGKKARIYIYNTYKTPAVVQTPNGCQAVEQPRDVIISVIDNPQLANPQLANPQLANPQLANPQLANSTFYVAPSDSVSSTGTAAAARRNLLQNVAFQLPGGDADLTIAIPPPATFITLSIQDGDTFQVGPPPPPPAPGEPPPPSNPPLTLEDFEGGNAALGVVSTAAPVINGVVQPIVESVSTSADLVFSSVPTVTPLSLQACGLVTVSSFDVTVVGNAPTAASGFRYGFYLSTTLEINPSTAVFLGSLTHEGAIAPGQVVTLGGGTFAIPPATTPGQYYVGVFINDGQLYAPPLNPYLFESFANDTVSLALTIAAPVGPAPTSASDAGQTNEDVTLNVAAPGVLGNDGNAGPVTAVLSLGASHGTVTLNANGSYSYVPNGNYFGPDSFTYYATNGTLASPLATVSITVQPVNDAPSFTKGPDQNVAADTAISVPGWAANISPGAANEQGQLLTFIVTPDNAALFAAAPVINPVNGTLTFTSGHVAGSTTVHVRIHDSGGTSPGVDTSAEQTFTVTVQPPPGPSANIQITQLRTPANPKVGDTVTYTVTVTNLGPDPADNVSVSDTYPQGLTWQSVLTTVGTCGPGDFGNSCSLGTLANGAVATITMNYVATAAQPVNHTVTGATATNDPVPANDTSTDSAMVVFAPCTAAEFKGPYFTNVTGFSSGILAVADFNKDGRPDIVVTLGQSANEVVILFGGNPTPVHVAVGANPASVSTADFNKDGNPDLAVVNGDSANVTILLGNGSGAFAPPANYAIPAGPFSSDVGDLNGDGFPDLVIGYGATTATSIAVLLNNGSGGFGAASTYPSGQAPTNVLVADFDGDGKLDVAVPNTGTTSIALLKGNGAGAFAAPATITLPATVQRLRYLGDVNKDGRPDLGVTTGTPSNLYLLLNQGGGTFGPPSEILPPLNLGFAVPGDFNKDGNPDVAIINPGGGRLIVLLGDGTGAFPSSASYATNANLNHLAVADLDGDGRLDIIGTSPGAIYTLMNTCGTPQQSNLTVTANASANVVNGSTFSVSANVTNHGPGFATDVRVTYAIPQGLSFVGATGNGTCTQLNGTVSCDVGSLNAGASASFTFDVHAFAAGARTHAVGATSATTELTPGDNFAQAVTTVANGASTFVVTSTADIGPGSLRQAISDSNLNTGSTNTVLFNIPGPLPYNILLNSQLPAIAVPVVIDGTSQPGYAGTQLVAIDGATLIANGLIVNAGGAGSTVLGLSILQFTTGVRLNATATITRNDILANGTGVLVFAPSTITGNRIHDNSGNGVIVFGSNSTIGGLAAGAGNRITDNFVGVGVAGGTGNAIRGNSIAFSNSLGIDIGQFAGLTPNDPGDTDSGPNNLQNFPVLTVSQVVGGVTTIAGTLNSNANTSFGVDLFSNASCNASGNGEGELYLGSLTVNTDASGNGSFSTTTFGVPLGRYITATATDPSGNTSEFSACRQVVTGLVVSSVDNPGLKIESGGSGSGFILLDAHHDGGPVPQVLATANLGPTGKPNLTLPGVMAVLPAGAGEPGVGYFVGGGRIGILDLASRQVTGAIDVEGDPTPTIVRANTVTRFAYFASGNRLFAIDGRSASPTFSQVVLTTTIGSQIRALALNESNGRLYVVSTTTGSTTSLFSSQITAIDANPANPTFHQVLRTGAVSSNTAVNDAAINPATNKIYIVDINSLRVVVDNGTTLVSTQIPNVPSGSSVAVNPAKNVVYVSNGFSNITVVDGATDTRITAFTLPTTGGPSQVGEGRLVIHNATGRVFYHYADGPRSSRITVLDGDPTHVAPNPNTFNTVLDTIDTGWETNASFMAIDQAADRLILYNNHTHSALIFNALTDAVVATAAFPQASIRPLALDLTTHTAYASVFAGAIQAIDLNTGAAQLIHTGTETRAPVVDKTSHLAYVPRTGADTGVAVVNASGLLSTITPPAGAGVLRFAERNATTNRIYVGNFAGNATGDLDPAPGAVSVIDGSTKSIIANINVGNRPFAIAVDEVLNKVYVGNTSVLNDVSANYQTWAGVTVIDGATNTATPANLNGIATNALAVAGLAVNPTTGRVYLRITSGSTATMGYYDPSTNTAAALPSSLGPVAVVKVNPLLNRIYLGASDNKLHVLDGTTHTEVATLTMGGSGVSSLGTLQNWIAINKTTGRVYVADRDADTLWIVNGQTNALVTSLVGLESPIAVAVNEAQNRVYVLDSGDDTLLVIDGTTNKIIQSIQLPMNPVAMAVDDNIVPAQIYVSGDCPGASGCVDTNSGVIVVSDPVDPNGPITLSAVGPAAHGTISLNPDGSLAYTSNAGFVGVDQFSFTVTDTHGASATGTINLYVVTLPQMTTTTLAAGRLGQPYSQALAATGGTPPYRWSINFGQLPPGLILNEVTGVISGVPSVNGTYSVTVGMSDENDGDSRTFQIIIGPIAITSGFPNPTVNTLYSNQLAAGGNTGPVTWSIDKQNSPLLNWLTLSPTGLLSGTPPNYGTLPQFAVVATDTANNETNTRLVTFNVGGPLDVVPTTLREGVVLETGQPALPIVGGAGNRTVTLTGGSLPPGVTMTSAGAFTGAPTNHGTFNFTVQVQDSTATISRAITWRVSAREQQGNTGAAGNVTFGGAGGRKLAQTFTVGAWGKLTGFGSFNLSCALLGPVTVEVQHLTPAGLPDGTTIASGVATSLFGAIAVSPALNVTIDEKMAFVLSSPTPCTISSAPTVDSYQAGDAFADSGSGWVPLASTADARYDLPFRSLLQPVVPLGYLITGRGNGTRGVTLSNGTILFTGTNNTAEIYNPTTRLSAATSGNMNVARNSHTATLLPDGKVLIAGGRDSSNNFLSSAEIFDPATGLFTPTGSLATARSDMTATLLPNGKVLIAGGNTQIGPISLAIASTELYDAGLGTFSAGPTMSSPRYLHPATVLNDGKILMAGGFGASGNASAELYDPSTNTFAVTLGSMEQWRGQARATLLSDGRVLVVGGQFGDNQPTAEIYDPLAATAAAAFTFTGSMSTPRQQHALANLNDGSVLVAGGLAEVGINSYVLPLASIERWVPGTGTFVKAGSMVARRQAPLSFTPNANTILWAGGSSQSWLTTNSIESFSLSSTPHLDTTTLPDGQVGVGYGPVTLTASGGSGSGYQINRISGALPPGVNYASNTLSGTPTAAGVYTLGFEVVDSLNQGNQQSLTLRVGALTITSPYRLTDGALLQSYQLQLAASSPATWSLPPAASANMPPGLTLSPSGMISGIPNTLGYYNFLVRAVDASGLSALKTLSINIVNPLTITTTSLGPGLLSQGYFGGCVGASGGVGNRTFDITAGAPPTGLTLNANGCFSGTIFAFGNFNFTVRVTDSASVPEQVSQPLSISVTMVDDQGTRSDNTQPPLTIGSGPIQKVAQRVIAGVTGALRGVRWYSPSSNSCPDGTMITAEIQGVAPNGSPDGNTVATGSAPFLAQYIPLPTGPFVTADQQFSVVFSVSNTCTFTPASSDSNPTEGWVYTSSWQRLSDYDGRSDIGMGTVVEPPAGLVPVRSFLGAHTATRLNDGRVLIVGQSQQAQIFDPATGLVTGTGSTNVLRSQYHQATLLDNGKVLITGGQTNTGSTSIQLDSAELYDPSTESFQLLASTLFGARANHTSTKLADGKVLITGGSYYDASNVYHTRNTAVVYDPSTNAFTQVGNMIASREQHTATLLKSPDNRVLVFGGWQNGGDNRGEFFDPNTLTFSTTTGFPLAYHGGGHTATLLDDGKVLIAGGWTSNEVTDVVELFDASVGGGTFTGAGTMLHPRQYHAAAKLADGSVLLSGGLFDSVCCILHQPHASLERYVPGTGIVAAGSMIASRYEHTATPLQSGQVLFTGTFGWSFGASHTGELYDPATAVSLANPILPVGSNGSAYSVVLNGRGGSGGYTISQLSGALPTGMSYTQSTRTLAGVPGQSGSFSLAISVIDSVAHTRFETVTLPVDPVAVTTIQLPSSHANVPYSASVIGTGVGTLTFSILTGSLPPGLNMASNGAVTGTTTSTCCFYGITVKVVDSIGQVSIRGVGISAQP